MTLKVTRGRKVLYLDRGTLSFPASDRSPSIQLTYEGDESGVINFHVDGKGPVSEITVAENPLEIELTMDTEKEGEEPLEIPLGHSFNIERLK